MATIRAIASGNWSSTSTWNGGVLPGNGDTVYANGFNVTINQDINIGGANNPTVNAGSFVSGQWYEVLFVGTTSWTGIGAASNTAGVIFLATGAGTGTGTARALATLTTAANTPAGASGGGGFSMPTVYTLTTDLRPGATTCLNVTATTGTLLLNGLRVVGGSASGAHGVNTTANSDLASCTFTGGGSSNAFALNNASTGTVNVSASCTFTGGVSGAFALNNASTGTVIVTGSTFTASAFTNAVSVAQTAADVRLSGDFLDHWSGWKAVSGGKWRLGTAPTLGQHRFALAGTTDSYFTEFGSDYGSFGNPIAANVRSGIVYGGGNLTGTCAVPAASSVAFGVPVDATTGTAVLTVANVQSALSAQGLTTARAGNLDNLDTTISSRLAPSGTLATVTNLTNAPASVTPADIWSHATRTLTSASGPTAVQIRQEMDSNSTKLANLDTTVSSRLAPNGTLATVTTLTNAPTVPTAAEIATAVEGSLLNEADGQAVLNAIVGAIGNTNLSEVSLVAAVRADLERSGGKLDSIPTTAAPTAAQNATAVWGASTKEITGGTVTNLTNAPASVTPTDIWSHANRTLTSASGPTAIEIRQEMDSSSTKLSAIKSKTDNLPADPADQSLLEAAIAGVTPPSAATVASAVRSELSSELTKVSALNTERLANVATTAIVGNLLAQANS